jgi:hypothetical protein
MPLGRTLQAIGVAEYDHRGDREQQVFKLLHDLARELRGIVPGHYLVPVSQGVGNLPLGLWVSILDPDVTTTPTKGIYVVFLYNENRTTVTLSLNQGVSAASVRARELGMPAKQLLRQEAAAVRQPLAARAEYDDLETTIELGPTNLLSKYEAGNIYGVTWDLAQLPPDDDIQEAVLRFLNLYADVVQLKEALVLGAGNAQIPPRDPDLKPSKAEREFKPKSDSDYRAHIEAAEQVRSRPHERLVARLGKWAANRGFQPNTNVHPRDLVLHRDDQELLVEVKVFAAGRPKGPLRECVGQLLEYRHFFCDEHTPLVAALSEHPGEAYLELLYGVEHRRGLAG